MEMMEHECEWFEIGISRGWADENVKLPVADVVKMGIELRLLSVA